MQPDLLVFYSQDMKFVLVSKDPEVVKATEGAFQPDDELLIFDTWPPALEACTDADLLFVDLIATLDKPHKIAGYEKFAEAKMDHATASTTPLVLIAQPDDYELDFMAGYPNFVFAHLRRPITYKIFRRASTWV
ncbi:hypothetical protein C0431_01260 [bacterium]|nr:hypothetical protein [bacterium]